MREIALHILDLAANSVSAGANKIKILVEENLQDNYLRILVEDNGKGIDAATLAKITDPFVTSRTERKVGLGIPLLKAAAESCNGWFSIESTPGEGTKVTVQFEHDHIDRMPLGDLANTFLGLELGTENVNWIFTYTNNQNTYTFDDAEVKSILEGVSLTEPSVINYIRNELSNGINQNQIVENKISSGELDHAYT